MLPKKKKNSVFSEALIIIIINQRANGIYEIRSDGNVFWAYNLDLISSPEEATENQSTQIEFRIYER